MHIYTEQYFSIPTMNQSVNFVPSEDVRLLNIIYEVSKVEIAARTVSLCYLQVTFPKLFIQRTMLAANSSSRLGQKERDACRNPGSK